jgi:nucleotide-binding universal stress UspA family protein
LWCGPENKARLELVTVLEQMRESEVGELIQVLRPENEEIRVPLRELRERVPDDARLWCDVQENVLAGPPAKVLLHRADALGADLIVMGTGDRLHLHGVWLGSTTGRILRQAHCPVLIVPGPERVVLEGAIAIPVGDWAGELARLTRGHHGQPATIAIMRDDLGTEREASALPFAGITLERHHGHSRVVIMLTKADGTKLTHVIHDPCSIRVGKAPDQSDVEMLFTARDGTATLFGVGVHQV